jgi:predicted CoA-substrate-specific enzyme activase
MNAGFDFGSKNISAVIIDIDKKAIKGTYSLAHNGNIPEAYGRILDEMSKTIRIEDVGSFGFTGNLEIKGISCIDQILAVTEANRFLNTGASSIISLGNQTFSLIILDKNGNYVEHTVNPMCASGTGSFLEQQAERIGLTADELAEMAYKFKGKAPGIATRCAVFAKSDIIHAQAEGFTREAIAAGLCEGIADSVISNLLKGRSLFGKVAFTGGLSNNRKLVGEIAKRLEIEPVVSKENVFFGAIGAALLGNLKSFDTESLTGAFKIKRDKRERLTVDLKDYPDFSEDFSCVEDEVEITEYDMPDRGPISVYMGIDIGSTSTKSVVMDARSNIIAGFYTKTRGEPVNAVRKLMKAFEKVFSGFNVEFLGVGTTGSGRKLIKSVLNADLEINEITAHAKSAVFIDPSVDSIIEIGGQDSKFTLLKGGNIVNANMNYVCAAGTGSFIEEQALRLGVKLDEISALVEGREAPYTSDRCTVYMERDLNIFLAEGWSREEILASVLYSVKDNYLARVVGKVAMGEKIFFQGATARNKALVSVFKNDLKKDIVVSKYCHLTGALGAALILKERNFTASGFVGTGFDFESSNETCGMCINRCELTVYEINGRKTAWGLKCGREYDDRKHKKEKQGNSLESKFDELFGGAETPASEEPSSSKKTVGIPLTLNLREYYPLFRDFFETLGFDVVLESSSKEKIRSGSKINNSDFCAPIIASFGVVRKLLEKNPDYVFFPSVISDNGNNAAKNPATLMEKERGDFFCYYSEYAPDIISNLKGLDAANKMLMPKIVFDQGDIGVTASDIAKELSPRLGISAEAISESFIKCHARFVRQAEEWKAYGRGVLKSGPDRLKILFIGRPYSVLDASLNFGIPSRFEEYGFDIAYQSAVDTDESGLGYAGKYYYKMHWYYGQEIIKAAEYAAKNRNVYPVFLSCFRCSPDSYLLTYFKDIMDEYDKPYLVIQLDDHESDVGYTTRIEAAVETFINDAKINSAGSVPAVSVKPKNDRITEDLTVLIPYLSPVISDLQKHCFESYGYKAMVLPLDRKSVNTGYKYASGSECLPNVAIAGSLIDSILAQGMDPENTVLYMPTACLACNFNQFAVFIEYACRKAGLEGVKISNPNVLKHVPELPKELNVALLDAGIMGSLIYKLYYRIHPYESVPGETQKAFDDAVQRLKNQISHKSPLSAASSDIRKIFENVRQLDIKRKPRIGITGDLYLKYNLVLNQDVYGLVEELGGEIVMPSFTETTSGIIHADVFENGLDKKFKRGLTMYERHFEKAFEGMLDGSFEPPIDECYELMKEYGIRHYIPGETSINTGRILYFIKHKAVDAILHLNPVFCCPGVVSSSIFRKIQKDFGIPVIDIFYDGTNKPNGIIIPQLYYLNGQK